MTQTQWSIEIPSNVFFGVLAAGLVLMVAAAVVAILVRLVRTWRPKHRQRAVDDLSRRMNLVVPEHVREPLAHAIALRKRGAELGAIVMLGVLAGYLRPWQNPPPEMGFAGLIPVIAMGAISVSLGNVVGGFFAHRTAPTEQRTARLTPLKFSDLIAPVERRLLASSLIAGVIFPTILTLLALAPWAKRSHFAISEVPLLLLAGLVAAGLGLSLPRIGRMLVSKRAIAGDEHALAWSDALAARTLRDLAHLSITVGGLAGIMSIMATGLLFPTSWENVANAWISIVGPLGFVAIVALGVLAVAGQSERHVQRTLWPQFAADAK